jgi:hypothetical protein
MLSSCKRTGIGTAQGNIKHYKHVSVCCQDLSVKESSCTAHHICSKDLAALLLTLSLNPTNQQHWTTASAVNM